jgi:molybdate transport system regulatory protein
MVMLKLRSRQWIVDENDHIIFGDGRREILETIERTGSINRTAKLMKMSYKGVWGKIKATERNLKTTLVHTDRKKGAWLSRQGKSFLEQYRILKQRCVEAEEEIFTEIFEPRSGANRGRGDLEP